MGLTVAGVQAVRSRVLLARSDPDRGRAFLIYKATHEIHAEVEGEPTTKACAAGRAASPWSRSRSSFDLVFSLDSIITAIGMAQDIEMMIAAVVIAVVVMYVASGPVAGFVDGTRPPRCWRSRSCC